MPWKKAWITPVFEKGGCADPANYRRVSLTSTASKLLEHIFCTHIQGHADQHCILGEANRGFRAKHSTETQHLFAIHDMLKNMKNRVQGKQLDVAILDLCQMPSHQRLRYRHLEASWPPCRRHYVHSARPLHRCDIHCILAIIIQIQIQMKSPFISETVRDIGPWLLCNVNRKS